ncbi:hypothetical protein J25TS5_30930 [Paenibacillus faecis]|uniref:hypothetical protein n=1 Tax=Paenibacillus faecis TaxID=862114 RepID=UPI001B11E882|nr:hypothetical protein [Paenibacillus faecis]GIO86161.1 hypothetical protein J25TS5_30930 [Paenibacillus faecis]
MRKMILLVSVILMLAIPVSAGASPDNGSTLGTAIKIEPLTQEETNYLRSHVGLSETEISTLPETMLRQMIDMQVVKVASKSQSFSENPTTGEIQPSLDANDLTLQTLTTVQASDKPGYKKYNMWGYFSWKKDPVAVFTDKMTIGVPESVGFFLPVSNNSISQFTSTYEYNKNGTWYSKQSTTPSDWKANSGVAGKYDLVSGTNYLHRGYISQNIYINSSKSDTTNLTLEYGHSTVSFEPSVSISPTSGSIGITIKPGVSVYKIPYEFKY